MKITLKQMRVFDAIARLGSVSAAAQEISITQSAASMALRELESCLGVKVFDRRRRQLILNEYGRKLQPKVRSSLVAAQDVEASVHDDTHQGVLNIGASTTIGSYVLPSICADFMQDHPGVRINLTVLPALQVLKQVDEMNFDLGFVEAASLRQTLQSVRWMEDELFVCCASNHRLASQSRVYPKDLAKEIWCLQPHFSVTRSSLTRTILNHIDAIHVGLETGSIEAIKQFLLRGQSVACLSKWCIQKELEEGSVRKLDVIGLQLRRSFNIIFRKDIHTSNIHRGFIDRALAANALQEPASATGKGRLRKPSSRTSPGKPSPTALPMQVDEFDL